MKKKTIFVVHTWETCDGLHHVHIWNDTEHPTTEYIKEWREAFRFAYKKAMEMGLDYFQVDHPDFPHEFIKVL